MVECQCHCPLAFKVSNEGNGKEEVGRDVDMSNIVFVIDEGKSSRAGDKYASLKVWTLRIRELNLWIWKIIV